VATSSSAIGSNGNHSVISGTGITTITSIGGGAGGGTQRTPVSETLVVLAVVVVEEVRSTWWFSGTANQGSNAGGSNTSGASEISWWRRWCWCKLVNLMLGSTAGAGG
jgi:hypothetical protein